MSFPPHLYKYRRFSQNVLQELCDGSVYFASPESFNDPLDSKPSFIDDLDTQSKKALFAALYREHAPQKDPNERLSHLLYLSTEGADADRSVVFNLFLSHEIEGLFLGELRKLGVFSLAENWNCPLMWSHYADQHAGICLEFSTKDHVAHNLSRVRYDGNRSIHLSELASWKLRRDIEARKSVLDTALLSKAPAWSYEREWRIVSKSPDLHSAPLELSAIYFGERCPHAVQTMLVKTLHNEYSDLSFYDIGFDSQTFELRRVEVDIDEVVHTGVRPSAALVFGRQMNPLLPPGAIALTEAPQDDEGEPYLHG